MDGSPNPGVSTPLDHASEAYRLLDDGKIPRRGVIIPND
jgi:hypothetical protein